MKRSGLDTMAARVFVLLLIGILATAVLAFGISNLQARATAAADREQRLIDRIADAAAVLAAAPTDARPDRLGVGPEAPWLVRSSLPVGLTDDPILSKRVNARLGDLAVAVVSSPLEGPCDIDASPAPPPPPDGEAPPSISESAPAPPAPPMATPIPPPPSCRFVRLRFPSGERLSLIAPQGPRPPSPPLPFGAAPLLAVAVAAGALAWAVARLTVAPLTRLAQAAYALGEDIDRPPLAIDGPREVRKAAQAFNAMQSRLQRGMEERTHMLAAITHDLQTPLTRQRLRLERIADPELREQLLADQEAMRVLIREGLDLARAAHDGEGLVMLEVDSLLDSLAEDAVAAGQAVSVTGTSGCAVRTHPQALRRALANLLDNALKYAGSAELSAERSGRGVLIRVLDRGPGVPEHELQAMFEPFRRGESSRSRDTGGAGLGLTIARLLAGRCGVQLSLNNRKGGGLEASLLLD